MPSLTRQKAVLTILDEQGQKGATGVDFVLRGGGMDWRKRISELRSCGWDIDDKWEKKGRSRYKRYFFKEQV